RLVSSVDKNVTLRAFHHRDEDWDIAVSLYYAANGGPTRMIFTAIDTSNGALLAHLSRHWKTGGDFAKCWAEIRRQVRMTTNGVDIGAPPVPAKDLGVQ